MRAEPKLSIGPDERIGMLRVYVAAQTPLQLGCSHVQIWIVVQITHSQLLHQKAPVRRVLRDTASSYHVELHLLICPLCHPCRAVVGYLCLAVDFLFVLIHLK
jgi:hypothetical protein